MNNKSEVFYCYSPKLKCELFDIGERYIAKAKHHNGRYYWMFLRTESLNKYLDDRPKTEK